MEDFNMKKFGNLFFAAVLGSGITMGTYQLIGNQQGDTLKIEHVDKTPAYSASYGAANGTELAPLSFTEVAEKVTPAVVHIKSTQTYAARSQGDRSVPDPFRDFFGDEDFFRRFFGPQSPNERRGPQPRVGTGSGVIINSEGYIVTNNHVVEGADDIEVTMNDNRTFKASIIGTDPTTDLALIQVKEKNLPSIPFINSDDVKVGEWVLAVGNPFNLNSTVTAGIVSAKGRNINILREDYAVESFIQTDAAINPGNSGGALVNIDGGLVGINTAIASPTGAYSGYGFAVPSNIVNKVVEDLIQYGTVQRGVLGIGIRNLDGNLAREKDIDLYEGVYVDSVFADSGAEIAGIQEGDVIVEVNGNDVKSSPELMGLIARKRPGDEVSLKVYRNGKMKDIDVTLKNRNGETKFIAKEEGEILSVLGVRLQDIDKQTANKLDIPGGVKVVEMQNGKLKRHTDMREGFIITKIDNKPVKNAEELVEILEDKRSKNEGVMVEGVYEDYPGEYYYAFGL